MARFPLFPLMVLGGAIFVSVTSEFLPTGLLPDMAADLEVSESRVGLLVTVFAATVVVSTAPLTVLTRRYSRKGLMIVLLAAFALSNVLSAIAPTYELLIGARIFGGLAHGLFWAVTGPYVARLVPRAQLVRALSITGAGGTAAFVFGVPLGTVLGHAVDWRFAFMVMAGIVVVFTVLVVLYLPPVEHLHTLTTGEIGLPYHRDRTIPAVLAACVLVLVIMLGHNTFNTYIVPWLLEIAHFEPASIGPVLFVSGAAAAIGLFISGMLGDKYPRAAMAGVLAFLGVSVALFSAAAESQWVTIAVLIGWGIAFGGLPSMLHAKVFSAASPRIRDVAAAAITTAFNTAIGGGALLGGILFDAFGVGVLPWAYVAFIAIAIAFLGVLQFRSKALARA